MNNRKIDSYELISSRDQEYVIKEVKEGISKDWEPLGPIQVTYSNEGNPLYTQTMVKYEPPTEMEINDALNKRK